MPDYSEQQADVFVVEPVTQLDGSPAPQPGRPGEATWRKRLQPGVIALAEGAALLLCFFTPWVYFPDFEARSIDVARPVLLNYSGFSAGLGISFGGPLRIALFVDLWLIPITALALLAVAWVYRQRRFSARLTLGSIMALSALALLVEAGFYVQVQLLKPALYSDVPPSMDVIDMAWGFWVVVAATLVAVIACVYQLRTGRVQAAPAEPTRA